MNIKKFKCPICGNEIHLQLTPVSRDDKLVPGSYVMDTHPENTNTNYSSMLVYGSWYRGECLEGNTKVEANFDAFACSKCGHVSLFASKLISSIAGQFKTLNEQKEELTREIETLQGDLAHLKEKIDPMEKRAKEVIKLLKSDEITVRQQRELKKELESLNERQKLLVEFGNLQEELRVKESKLTSIEFELNLLKTQTGTESD